MENMNSCDVINVNITLRPCTHKPCKHALLCIAKAMCQSALKLEIYFTKESQSPLRNNMEVVGKILGHTKIYSYFKASFTLDATCF